jgi:hypothetical protein
MMTRRDEVESSIKWIMSAGMTGGAITPSLRDLARTLADEVDRMRADREALTEIENCDLRHHVEVLTPVFQCGGTHTNFARLGEGLVDAVPRMVEAYETMKTELATLRTDILAAIAYEEGGNNHDFHPCNRICREIRAIVEVKS